MTLDPERVFFKQPHPFASKKALDGTCNHVHNGWIDTEKLKHLIYIKGKTILCKFSRISKINTKIK